MTVREIRDYLYGLPDDAQVYVDCDEYTAPVQIIQHFPRAVRVTYRGGYSDIITDKTMDQVLVDPSYSSGFYAVENAVVINRSER